MPDVPRTQSQLKTDFATNHVHAIDAQRLRNFVVSIGNLASPQVETRTGSTSTTWDLTYAPTATCLLFLNGSLLANGIDFDLTGTTITLFDAVATTDIIQAIYWIAPLP